MNYKSCSSSVVAIFASWDPVGEVFKELAVWWCFCKLGTNFPLNLLPYWNVCKCVCVREKRSWLSYSANYTENGILNGFGFCSRNSLSFVPKFCITSTPCVNEILSELLRKWSERNKSNAMKCATPINSMYWSVSLFSIWIQFGLVQGVTK